MAKKIPVFFINGFLDAGKTTFIKDTLQGDAQGEEVQTTLLLVCEQGEVEYEEEILKKTHTIVKYIEEEASFDYKEISAWIKEIKPDRIVMEMNGMWELTKLQFPREIEIIQVITFVDASTFATYFNNMRQKFTDSIKRSQIVCFTKLTDMNQILPYQTALKLINKNCSFFIMDENEKAKDAFEEPLPYDVDAPIIQIKDEDYGTFYIDTFDNKDRYEGKTVEYDIQVILSDKLPKDTFIGGRFIMNCCSNDIQLYGFLVKSNMGLKLVDRSFVHLKAKVSYEWSDEYKEEELMLTPLEINVIPSKKEEVLNLTGSTN